jgi:hypothetical protein
MRVSTLLFWLVLRLQIEFESLSYIVKIPLLESGITNIGTAICGAVTPRPTKVKAVLTNCSGVLSPGTLTLVSRSFFLISLAVLIHRL